MPASRADRSSATAWRLLAQIRRSRSGALGRLVERCLPDLKHWAHRRLPRWARAAADTSDLVQDAALHTLRRGDRLDVRGRRALASYLREAVRNQIRDEHRRFSRRGVHQELGDASDALADRSPSPFDVALADERHARYRAALEQVSAADRELIVAHLELGYSHDQLGCMTGRSRNAARMALERAIGRLAVKIRDA